MQSGSEVRKYEHDNYLLQGRNCQSCGPRNVARQKSLTVQVGCTGSWVDQLARTRRAKAAHPAAFVFRATPKE